MSAGAGAGTGTDAGAAAGGADTAAGASGQDTIAGGAWQAPDYLPDHLKGATVDEAFAKVAEDWKTKRDQLAEREPRQPQLPDKPEGYEFQALDSLKDVFGDTAEDPIIKIGKASAHKWKMTPDQMNGFINEVVGEANKLGLLKKEEPVDYAAEALQLVPEEKRSLPEAERKALAKARVDEAQTFGDTLLARKEIDEAMHQEIGILLESAAGVRLLEFMRKGLTSEGGVRPLGSGQAATDAVTHEDLQARQADPRYSTMSPKHDPRFREETDAMYRKLFPGRR